MEGGSLVSAITPDLLERARGAVLGAAVGDAFGMALEGSPPQHVNAQIRRLRPGRLPAGHFTENSGAILTLGECLLEEDPLNSDELAARLVAWQKPARPGGRPLLARLLGGRLYDDQAPTPAPDVAEAVPLVRCIPAALANIGDRNACLRQARSLARLTHTHPDVIAGTAFMAAYLWHLLHGMAPRHAMHEAVEACGDLSEPLVKTIQGASARPRECVANGELAPALIESTVRGFLRTGSFAEAVVRVTNLGGNGAMAGTLIGALAGAAYRHSGIPANWRTQAHGLWPPRGGRLWRERELVELAERLVGIWALGPRGIATSPSASVTIGT